MQQKDLAWIAVSIPRHDMHVEMGLMLTGLCPIVLKYIHSKSTKGFNGCARNVLHETVHTFEFPALNVQNGLTMPPWNNEHRPALVLALIKFCYRVLILGDDRELSCTRQIVAEAAGRVRRELESHWSLS